MCKLFVKFFLFRIVSGNVCDLERIFCGMVFVYLVWLCYIILEVIFSNSVVLIFKGKDYFINFCFIFVGLIEVYSWGNGVNY